MKPWKIIVAAISALVLIVPLTAYATTSMFGDVPDSHIFVEDINWMKTSGVSNGCGNGTNYCPNDNVTRGQMAAFMHRLATKQVVTAGSLGGNWPSDFMAWPPTWVTHGMHFTTLASGGQVTGTAECPAGSLAIGGGGKSMSPHLSISSSRPLETSPPIRTWAVTWTNTGPNSVSSDLTTYVQCGKPGMSMLVLSDES
jgi:hypothetical protein